MKICKECGIEYGGLNTYGMTKYCSDACRKVMRKRFNAVCKERAKQKVIDKDVDFVALSYFKKYRQRSPSRKLAFELSLEFFKKNVFAPCYYCNDPLKAVGFDRLDNEIGYTEENCVPCCIDCNFMKRSFGIERFIELCRKIAGNKRFN